jgi:hypothetical protein
MAGSAGRRLNKRRYIVLAFLALAAMESAAEDNYQEMLVQALRDGDTARIRGMLSNDKIYGSLINNPTGVNPLTLAYDNKCIGQFKTIVKLRPELLTMVTSRGTGEGQIPPIPPTIFKAVAENDLEATKELIRLGFPHNWSMPRDFPANILFAATSDEMRKLLISYGVDEIIEMPSRYRFEITATDDNINVRQRPNRSGKIVGKAMSGQKGIVTKFYAIRETIEDRENYWVFVKFPTFEGWTFAGYYLLLVDVNPK